MQMTTEQTSNNHETLSALADGQLRGTAFAKAVDLVLHDDELQATWHEYHLIGDVLRSADLGHCASDKAFLTRLSSRLAQEPGFARPVTLAQPAVQAIEPAAVTGLAKHGASVAARPAANEAGFRWKMVAGFASMAAVAAIGWNLVGGPGTQPAASSQMALVPAPVQVASEKPPVTQLAQEQASAIMQVASPSPAPATTTRAVTLASGEPQVMIRDPRLDELMAAHKQFGGTSALQMPAGFLRNATFEGPAR
jgi:sigma-E factor negative regulatory protein RseA